MKVGLTFGTSMLSLRDKEATMKIRYAIEKEIEVPDNYSDTMIDDILKEKCRDEEGFSWIWQDEDETTELFEFFNE